MPIEYETHDIPDIGEFRSKAGTAISELAGAASYWNKQWQIAKRANDSKFLQGFFGGLTLSCLVVGGIKLGLYLFS